MKKHKFSGKMILALITVVMSTSLLFGCQSKSNNNTSTNTSSGTNQTTSSSTQNSKSPNQEDMKKQMQEDIKSLVTAGTITQAQADKIIEALTPSDNSKKDSQQNPPQNPPQQNNNEGSNKDGNQNKPKDGRLSKLVTDGTITQAQADAVMQKIKKNPVDKNNGQSTQNGGQGSQSNTQTSN